MFSNQAIQYLTPVYDHFKMYRNSHVNSAVAVASIKCIFIAVLRLNLV